MVNQNHGTEKLQLELWAEQLLIRQKYEIVFHLPELSFTYQ